jgi:hypothetical protein
VPDIGVAALDHDLHAVEPAALIAPAEQVHVADEVRLRQIDDGHWRFLRAIDVRRRGAPAFAEARG